MRKELSDLQQQREMLERQISALTQAVESFSGPVLPPEGVPNE